MTNDPAPLLDRIRSLAHVRIDEIFGVYLPDEAERQEILCSHLRRRKRDPELFDLETVAQAVDGYTGADIEQVVITGLKLAFHAGEQLETQHLLTAATVDRRIEVWNLQRLREGLRAIGLDW